MILNTKRQSLKRQAPQAATVSPAAADPLREIRSLKRLVQVGVYAAIIGTEPFYLFVLHYSWPQLLIGLCIGLIIATVAIEGAFGQMFKLRKRSAYAGLLLQALSGAPGVAAAAEQALPLINRLLGSPGSAVVLRDETGGLRVLSVSAMTEEDARRLLERTLTETARVLEGEEACVWLPAEGERNMHSVANGERVALVPVTAMTGRLGVLVLVERRGKSDLGDIELLQSVGRALGLSLESLRGKEELASTASLLSTALESTADGILVVAQDGKIESFNAKFAEMWGIPGSILDAKDDDQALAFVLEQLQGPEAFLRKVRELYAQPDSESNDTLQFKDGRVFERFSRPRRLNGHNVGRVWSFRDVTETRRAEAALAANEQRFRALIENTSDGISLVGSDGNIIYVSPSIGRILGYASEEIVGMSAFALIHPDDRQDGGDALAQLLAHPGEMTSSSSRFRHSDGSWRWIEGTATNLLHDPAVRAVVVNYRDITERRQAEEALAANEQRFRALIENSSDGIVLLAPDGRVTYASPSTERILGYSSEEMVGLSSQDLVHPDDRQPMLEAMAKLRAEPGASATSLRRLRHKDGSWRWIESTATNLLHEPIVGAIVANYRDVTERLSAVRALKESEEHQRSIQESALDAIITMSSDGEITSWNPQAETIFGWTHEEAVGRPLAETLIPPRDRGTHKHGLERIIATGDGPILNRRIEVVALDRSGREFPVEVAVVPLYRGENVSFCAFLRDISERKKAEETIRHLAYHDVLTGLPNRVLFEERLRIALAQARRSRAKVAIMFLDLDRFKLVNDTVGHTGGDQLLQEVAREFSDAVREGDTVARVGGDEFTFLLPGIDHAEDATIAAERILQRVRKARTVAGQEFRVTTSIGISVFPRDGSSAEVLMRNADTAMYRAKERGRDNCQLYTRAMKASLQEMLALENDLSHALERDELFVLYQPLVRIDSGSIVGGEALLRWQHPRRGLVGPDEFIPLAEETGLIGPIGEWVLRAACQQAKAWHDLDLGPMRITVNVSARQLDQPGLVRIVGEVLSETGLPPQRLQLELTEGAMMRQVESVTSTLSKLRAMGVGISVDDFGTGYSSLGYLKRFPIDTIKIDRSFVRDVTTDQNDAAIVTTVIAMARGLSLRVVAEGVETEAQLGFLRENKCDEFQGFLLSRPISPAEFEALVRQRQGRQARVVPLKSG